jgi:hypothetical protein
MAPDKSRRWPRHQVKLPVRIIAASDASKIAVPGLTTEISRGGMALYGGVPLQPGDLMEVEFETFNRLRIAGAVRDRNGYCFGLEFLTLLPEEDPEVVVPDLAAAVLPPRGLAGVEADDPSQGVHVEVFKGASEIFSLFLERHSAYLQQKEQEIQRMRQELAEIRNSRQEIEALARQFLGRLH